MKKRFYSSIAITLLLASAISLLLVMISLFDVLGEDMTLKSDQEIASAAIY